MTSLVERMNGFDRMPRCHRHMSNALASGLAAFHSGLFFGTEIFSVQELGNTENL